MGEDDHLSGEVSVSVKLTDSGIEGKAKSRAVSGIDRLMGNVSELFNVFLEEKTVLRRGRISAQKKVIEAATAVMIERIESDTELAERALNGSIIQSVRRQENKESVLNATTEKLKLSPPTKEQEEAGEEKLSPDFLNAFERYAEDASDEDIRQKWANVLAAEIRTPGAITKKSMRVIDEIDGQTAHDFTNMCREVIYDAVPLCVLKIEFGVSAAFIEYDLINSDHPNVVRTPILANLSNGSKAYVLRFGDLGCLIEEEGLKEKVVGDSFKNVITWDDESGGPTIPIILLTKTGMSISKIIPSDNFKNMRNLVSRISALGVSAFLVTISPDGEIHFV